ncbi:ribosome biogenesis factor YjgA [Gammaproteobacteria bacterium AS21]|jgi:ribosome-associated protein
MNNDKFDTYEDDDEDWISKSSLKRDAEALQVLGSQLIDLKPSQLDNIEMDETLRDAIDEAKRLKVKSGAFKRQCQYIGKLMRFEDPEAIELAINKCNLQHEEYNKVFHRLERWRERLLANDEGMLDVILEQYPQTDIQYIRQLIRNTQKEISSNKPPLTSKKLFKYLRELEGC